MVKRFISLITVFIIIVGLIPTVALADPASLDNWIPVKNTLNGLTSITFGSGKFVAIGNDRKLVRSTDAVSWEKINSDASISGLCYCNGKFVAVGNKSGSAYVMISSDGVSWKSGLASKNVGEYSPYLFDVAYGNGKYVAVGGGTGTKAAIMTSSDGTPGSWTNIPLSGSYTNVFFGNGKFVLIGRESDKYTIYTSSDGGVNWTYRTSYRWGLYDVAYGNGVYVAVGLLGAILTSKDGVTWTDRSISTNTIYNGIIFVNGTFVAVGTYGIIMTSSNGESWTQRNSGDTNSMFDAITYGNGTLVIIGSTVVNSGFTGIMVYSPPIYTVTYNDNGSTGGTVPTDRHLYPKNAPVSVPGNTGSLVKTGYKFEGWNTTSDGNGTTYAANAVFNMGTASVILYAKWTADEPLNKPAYTVTYSDNGSTGGTVPKDSNTYEQSAPVTVSGNTGSLVRTGYTFAGWNTAADGSGTSYAGSAVFSMEMTNVTLYAEWTPNEPAYTVTYKGNGSTGGSVPTDNHSYEQIKIVTVLGNTGGLVNNGHTFAGWNTEQDGSGTYYGANDEFNMGGSNVTLYAQWASDPTPAYTVTYNGNGSTGGDVATDSNSYTQNASVTVSGNTGSLVNPGYTFAGWNTAADGSGISYAAGVELNMGAANVTLYAQWTTNQAPIDNTVVKLSDISGHWAEANIKQAVSGGIVGGYPNGTFKPDKTVTRAEFAVMLVNTLKPQGEGAVLTFIDTAKIGSWAQKAVAQAAHAGMLKGYADGSFRPDAVITRAEMAAMIANALGQSIEANAVTGFADDNAIPGWAKGSVAIVLQEGIVQGKGDNKFAPQDQATRAEAVTVLLKMLAYKNK